MGPFELVIHVVQCRHAGEQWKRRNGRRQTKIKEIVILNDVNSVHLLIPLPKSNWPIEYLVELSGCGISFLQQEVIH